MTVILQIILLETARLNQIVTLDYSLTMECALRNVK